MIGTGKAFRMARVHAAKQQIDMRYSRDDGMWYPSQPASRKSASEGVIKTKAKADTGKLNAQSNEKSVLMIICDTSHNPVSNHDEGAADDREDTNLQLPLILILEMDPVQDQPGDYAEVVYPPEPPADVNGPLSGGRSVRME